MKVYGISRVGEDPINDIASNSAQSEAELFTNRLRFENPSFRDDTGDEFGRSDIEGGIVDGHIFGSDRMAAVDARHLNGISLFDGNLIP